MCVCVFVYLFAPALSVSAPFLLSLIASNQLIHDFCKWVIFEEKRYCGNKIFDNSENFWYPFHVIQIAAASTWQMVLIYIYMGGSVYWPMSVLCVFVCVRVFVCVWYQIRVPAGNHIVSDLSKLDALLYKTHTKVLMVLRFQGLTCIEP